MPELPEVETVRRQLEPLVVRRRIAEAWGHPSAKFSSAPLAAGATIDGVARRGKYLLLGLDDQRDLVVHLGMTGQLRLRPGELDPYVRAWWRLDDGAVLELRDVRRFGRVAVVPAGEHGSLPTLAHQGPEPWDPALDAGGLWRNLRRSRVRIKTQLLSQRPIAGVGNIYADEALWRAGIHPGRRSVTRGQAQRLLEELRAVLEQGIANGGTTLRDYRTPDGATGRNQLELACYGRAGEPCARCGTELRRTVIDARGTTHCPACQPR
ncbi:MAG: bifunctional DNA-formamidopyrimidine glycosylase/DNA-(apurinic or apyrimidinic site) lyase [Acidimicrobiales bacterium]